MLPAVILGGCILGLALGARHVQGLFLVPITTDRSWPREVFGLAIALQNLVWGFSQPFTGMLADRFGSARVIAVGIVLYALGLVVMALSPGAAGFTFGAGFVTGIALACTSFGLIYGALSRILPESRRAWALATAAAVGGLVQFLMVPGAQALIQKLGWSGALLALAALVAVFLPASAMLKDGVDTAAGFARSGPDSIRRAVSEAFGHKGFLLLNAGFLACGFQLAFIAIHLPAYILDRGVSASVAVNGLAIIAFANIFGAYWCGVLGGLYRRKNVLAWIYVARSAAIAAFVAVPPSSLTVYLFCAAMGLLWLGTVPLTNGLVSQVFGVRYISTLFRIRLSWTPGRRLRRSLAGGRRLRRDGIVHAGVGWSHRAWPSRSAASRPDRRHRAGPPDAKGGGVTNLLRWLAHLGAAGLLLAPGLRIYASPDLAIALLDLAALCR